MKASTCNRRVLKYPASREQARQQTHKAVSVHEGGAMADLQIFDRIVVSREIMHGKPRIAGTRVTVNLILDLLAAGKTPAEITSNEYYPDLTEADVRACIAYASQIIRDDHVIPAR
jgi:uncharacterized protein (DUF433 family)